VMTDPPSFPPVSPLNYAGPNPYPPSPAPARGRGLIGWVLFLAFAVMLFMLLRNQGRTFTTIPYNEFNDRLKPIDSPGTQPDRIEWLRLEGDTLFGKFVKTEDIPERGPVTYFRVGLPQGMGSDYRFFHEIVERVGLARFEVEPGNNLVINILLPLVPWLLIFGFVWFFILRPLRQRSSNRQLIISGPGRWIPDPPAPQAPPK
jgi:preprotein translocase subunit YajC